jgi:hypothetical protein
MSGRSPGTGLLLGQAGIVLEFAAMRQPRQHVHTAWQITVALLLLCSQTLLLAHVHEQDPVQAQYASCVSCIALQIQSPACSHSFPEADVELARQPHIADTSPVPRSAPVPRARQRAPPALI